MKGKSRGKRRRDISIFMKPAAVIFDIDNTLYDYTSGNAAAMNALADFAEGSLHVDPQLFRAYTQEGYELFARRMKGLAASHSRLLRFQYVCRKMGIPEYPFAFDLAKLYWDTLLQTAVPEPGLIDLLKALKGSGIIVAVGTNMTAPVQFKKLRTLDVGKYIDFVFTSEETGAEKPLPAFFQYITNTLGVTSECCVFIGDDALNDYNASINAGMLGLWYAARPGFRADLESAIPETRIIRSYRNCLREDEIHLGDNVIRI